MNQLLTALTLTALTASPALAQHNFPFPQAEPVTPSLIQSINRYASSPSRIMRSLNGTTYDVGLPGIRGGGTGGRPPGSYNAGIDTRFHSGYAGAPADQKGEFAAELYHFIVMQGGGYATFCHQAANNLPLDVAHVPYSKQSQFAEFWWRTHNPEFKDTAPLFREWWINDALLDATNLYCRFDADRQGGMDSMRLMYLDGSLWRIKNRK